MSHGASADIDRHEERALCGLQWQTFEDRPRQHQGAVPSSRELQSRSPPSPSDMLLETSEERPSTLLPVVLMRSSSVMVEGQATILAVPREALCKRTRRWASSTLKADPTCSAGSLTLYSE